MDPYLEMYWRDVHSRLIVYICDQIQSQIGGKLRARVEERLVVEADGEEVRNILPGASVFVSVHRESDRDMVQASVGLMEPPAVVIPVPSEDAIETHIEIIDRASGDKLITVIALLSPSNKLGDDAQHSYLRRQKEIRAAGVNTVEIDLTRRGRRKLPIYPIPRPYRTTFQALVYRATSTRRQFEIYPLPLQVPLCPIPVPLRYGDPDAIIDLQPLVEQAYRNGAYDDIDYSKPPVPPLKGVEATWAAELIERSGRLRSPQ